MGVKNLNELISGIISFSPLNRNQIQKLAYKTNESFANLMPRGRGGDIIVYDKGSKKLKMQIFIYFLHVYTGTFCKININMAATAVTKWLTCQFQYLYKETFNCLYIAKRHIHKPKRISRKRPGLDPQNIIRKKFSGSLIASATYKDSLS